MLTLKNPKTTIAGIFLAVSAVLASGVIVDFSPGAQKWLVLAGGILGAVGLVLAKDATTPVEPTPAVATDKPPAS